MLDRAASLPNSPDQGATQGYYPASAGSDELLSLAAIRAMLWRQRVILFGVAAGALLLALVVTLLTTPMYRSSATVHVQPQNQQFLEGQQLTGETIASHEMSRYLDTMEQIIASQSMALRVVDSLRLDTNRALMGDEEAAPPQGTSAAAWREQRRQQAASAIRGGISTEVPLNTSIIAITFTSPDPQLAAQVANGYAQNFLSDGIKRSAEANAFARKYLEEQIAATREELRIAELEANNYARTNRLVGQPLTSGDTADAGAPQTLAVATLGDVNGKFTEARVRRIAAEQRWRAIAGLPAAQIPEVQQNPAVQTLQGQLSQAGGLLADLRQRYRDDHPQVREALAQVGTIEHRLERTRADIKASLRQDYEVAARQERGLQAELDQVANRTLDEQDRRVQLNLIDREVSAKRTQLASLLERYNEISSASNIQASGVTLLDAAVPPAVPFSPDIMRNMLVGLVLGLGLAVALAIVREFFDDRLRSIEDVERKLGLTALGQTPHAGETVSDELSNPFSPLSEAYSSIRATLDFVLPPGSNQVIQFTSSNPAEGKTTSAIAIASKFAELGRKVLLVDMDLRRPAMSRIVPDARKKSGIVDVMFGRVPLDKAVQDSGTENLSILLVGEIPSNPVEILSSGLFPEFLAKHRKDYDVIIVDSSPVMGLADAPLLSRFVDAVIFVVEANRAQFGQTRIAVRRLRDVNARLVGTIVTKFRALEAGQSYDYRYTYYTYGSDKA